MLVAASEAVDADWVEAASGAGEDWVKAASGVADADWEAGEALVDPESSSRHQGAAAGEEAAAEVAMEDSGTVGSARADSGTVGLARADSGTAGSEGVDWGKAAAGSERAEGSSAQTARGPVPSRDSATRHSLTPGRIPDQSSRGWTLTQSCNAARRCTTRNNPCIRTAPRQRRMFQTGGR